MKKEYHLANLLFFTLTPIATVILLPLYLYLHGLHLGLILLFFMSFAVTNMSITCGYHRYFSHRSYKAIRPLELLYVFIGTGAFQGSVLEWSADHRKHHQKVDTDEDPYNINRGFWWAHLGWIIHQRTRLDHRKYVPDLLKDPVLRFQHRHYPLLATIVGFGLPTLFGWALGYGWGGLVFGALLRIVVSNHSTFLVNSMAHTFGRRPYNEGNSARDSVIVSLLTFGEGYHNFHHHWPADYRNGPRWYDWDPTKWVLRSMSWLGVTSNLKEVSELEILKAKLRVEQNQLVAKGARIDGLTPILQRTQEAHKRWLELRAELRRLKKALRSQARDRYVQLRKDVRAARLEFKRSRREWLRYVRSFETQTVRSAGPA